MTERVLVVAPHPDDEVLGPGGTVARLAGEGSSVTAVILTTGGPPLFRAEDVDQVRREAGAAHRVLGIEDARMLAFPAAGLDTVPHAELNRELGRVFLDVRPTMVFVPFNGDLHADHQHAFLSSLVCARPGGDGTPRAVYAYETLSETNWNAPYLTPGFRPNVFVDISDHLETKVEALRQYASQVRSFPHERSLETVRALATLRGSTVGYRAAEAFVLIREIR